MLKLRPYQKEAISDTLNILNTKKINPLIISPCGSGKSLIIGKLTDELLKNNENHILIITPRKKLLQQNAKHLSHHGICSASFGNDFGDEHRVILGTYQTLIKRVKQLKRPSHIIIDEAHLIGEEEYSAFNSFLKHFKSSIKIGLTATAFRGQKLIFGATKRWQHHFEISILDLILKGYLAPVRAIGVTIFDKVKDEKTTFIEEIKVAKKAITDALNRIKGTTCKRIMVFVKSNLMSSSVVGTLVNLNEKNVYKVDSYEKTESVDLAFEEMNKNDEKIKWLISINMALIGVDIPSVDCLVIIRAVQSKSTYIQIIGRGQRTHPNKKECLLLDYGNNIERHGLLTEIYNNIVEKGSRKTKNHSYKTCESCNTLVAVACVICENCGHEFSYRLNLSELAHSGEVISNRISCEIVKEVTVNDCVARIVTESKKVILHAKPTVPKKEDIIFVEKVREHYVMICQH